MRSRWSPRSSSPALVRRWAPATAGAGTLADLDIERVTIPELQAAMDAGDFTSVDLTSFYLNRIARIDPLINSVLRLNGNALAGSDGGHSGTNLGAVSNPRLLVVQHSEHGSPARLGQWLTDAGLELDVIAPYAGEQLPEDLSGHDGLLVLGGPQAAYDPPESVPWLELTQGLLRRAVAERLPTLAVCLGAQLLAQAMGGVVRRAENGPEIGAHLVAKRDVAAADPVFGPVPFTPDVIQWHYDEIVELPPGAVLLASSPAYVNQAFRVGDLAWGLQFHIETTPEMVAGWAEQGREAAEEWGYDVDAELDRATAAHDDIAEVWAPAAARFAALVQDHAAAKA